MARIIDNIEISIRNIYVRYEDSVSAARMGSFAVGVLLKELVTYTTGGDWGEKAMSCGQDITHKIIRMTDFRVFLDYESSDDKSEDGKQDPFGFGNESPKSLSKELAD